MSDFIFLGTGTSGGVPNVTCLTKHPHPTCAVCVKASHWVPPTPAFDAAKQGERSTEINGQALAIQTIPQFNHNRRNNTSGLYRYRHADGRMRHVVIDAGKTFFSSALQWFPYYNITTIDALLITHGHADAIFGLDDLRAWTIDSRVQNSIDIYLNKEAMAVVAGAFPYLVDSKKATGGGQIAALVFHVFDAEDAPAWELTPEGFPILDIDGLPVIPFEVEHGRSNGLPYHCLGFKFPEITYISDTNIVPDRVKMLIKDSPILVLDALRESSHPSHMSVNEAIALALEVTPKKLLLTDFCHDIEHDVLVERLKNHEGLKKAG
ncbi:hypothetical protein HDU98_010086 [Podochytrium sp. JEL0797]|nr:hypothetical protein HDU98_010086 [Podochytrium sp. JEL0797]